MKAKENMKVSICCITYNHEKYIADALEGFINQKTNFEYEILIHDDASTDNTANIIREYEKKYPNLIKPIYQTINQRSQNKKVSGNNYRRAKGQYIALCEGDDYWIDEYKLQKQVDYMDEHPDCTFCFTNALIEDQEGFKKVQNFIPFSERDASYYVDTSKIYDLNNTYELEFIPTASYLFPKKVLEQLPPTYYKPVATGDLKMRLYMTGMGYSYYINEITCVYRQNVPNSAMTKWKSSSRQESFERAAKVIEMIDDVDSFTDYKYSAGLKMFRNAHAEGMLYSARSIKELHNPLCRETYEGFELAKKMYVIVKAMLPDRIFYALKRCINFFK